MLLDHKQNTSYKVRKLSLRIGILKHKIAKFDAVIAQTDHDIGEEPRLFTAPESTVLRPFLEKIFTVDHILFIVSETVGTKACTVLIRMDGV